MIEKVLYSNPMSYYPLNLKPHMRIQNRSTILRITLATLVSMMIYSVCKNWSTYNMSEFCTFIQEWTNLKIFLQYNWEPKILHHIANIKFPNLIKIFLRSNKIQSIELLWLLDMPYLEDLWLGENNIYSIRGLKRINFPNLASLTLCNNKIQDFSYLQQMAARHLKQFDMERSQDLNKQFSISIMAKLDTFSPRFRIWILKNKRIKQSQAIQSIRRKFSNFQLH